MTNRLATETSPYLRQHAENPVDWFPWGEEALGRARAEDRPILLSIGYSACHWCHVMAHESFEDPEIARRMNESFVCVKVDREERPDLDGIYMSAVQAMTGQGGWPMTVFLTPDLTPFYGGTYFPPTDRAGLPGFIRVLSGVATAYRDQRPALLESAASITSHLRERARPPGTEGTPGESTLDAAAQKLLEAFDDRNGGFGGAPKFPPPLPLEFLLRQHVRTGDHPALVAVERTLEAMAVGGIRDQLGGGFHRYSTDEIWLVPHFEKMLYDNALLSRAYLHAWKLTGRPLQSQMASATLDYVAHELTSLEGGFYSSQDADSEGEEGRYYVWTPGQLADVLGPDDAELAGSYFGVASPGSFGSASVLRVAATPAELAAKLGENPDTLATRLTGISNTLFEARKLRPAPALDDKILACWNGLMLRSFAEAAAALGRDDYLSIAQRNAEFCLEHLRSGDRLWRSYRAGKARVGAYLEDYASQVVGLLALYEADFNPRWLSEARALAETMLDRFWDSADGVLYDTPTDHEQLIVRPHSLTDTATPAGSALAASALLRLTGQTNDDRYREVARRVISSASEIPAKHPTAFSELLCALDDYLGGPVEVAIVGDPAAEDTRALVSVARSGFRPSQVLAVGVDDAGGAVPLLTGRRVMHGRATAYFCHGFVCAKPTTAPAELARQLAISK